MGLIIFGAIVLIGAITIIIFSLRRNSQGEEDDPLQARLAEFIQRGDVKSLEEIELSQPFGERVIIPTIRRVLKQICSRRRDLPLRSVTVFRFFTPKTMQCPG